MPDQNYNTGDGLTPVAHHGDAEDVGLGRACPHCRTMLTEHNRAVWEAGYAMGVRHTKDDISAALNRGGSRARSRR